MHAAATDAVTALVAAMQGNVAVLDADGVIVAVSDAWRRFGQANGGGAQGSGAGSGYLDICADSGRPDVADGLRAVLRAEREEYSSVYTCHAPHERRWFRQRASPFALDGVRCVLVEHHDVTAHHLASDDARLRSRLLDEVAASVIATDTDFVVTQWNAAAARLYGWSRREALGQDVRRLIVPRPAEPTFEALEHLQRGDAWSGDTILRRRDGTEFPAHLRNVVVRDHAGTITGYVGVSLDMTERRRAEQHLRSAHQYLAAVTHSMAEGLQTLDEHGRLVYMNPAAEALLGWKLEDLAGRLLHPLTHGRAPDGTATAVHGCPVEDVFRRADGTLLPVSYTAAPFETPDGVAGSVVVFSDATQRRADRERLAEDVASLTWVTRIHEALAGQRLRVHAQPIYDLASGKVVQHELLVRMLDASGALLPPGDFLPAAERHGVVKDIDRWVIRQGLGLAARGHAVELNLSAASIGDPDMAGWVERALHDSGAAPALVVFELTETAILQDETAGRTFLERVSALGCRVALDDFGTGYGGFTYLKHLPVDFLKIDREFVRDLPHDASSQHVVRAVVQLALGTGKRTVAEGVEDAGTLALLREYGVDAAQGYYLGRPAPIDQTFPELPGGGVGRRP
jgi:PAS domain S-box-containing protein